MADQKFLDLFLESGLDERRAKETLKNAALKQILFDVLTEAKNIPKADVKKVVNLLYTVASTLAPEAASHRSVLVKYVVEEKIGKINITHALAYLKKLGSDPLNIATFEKESGVGVQISPEEVKKTVADTIKEKEAELKEQRYQFPIPALLATLRDKLKWADGKLLKDEFDAQILALLGEKTAADNEKKKAPPKKEKEPAKKVEAKEEEVVKELIRFPDPTENKQLSPELLEKHLKTTGGAIVCRFPPEPNGFLHIGHAKSMNLNFSYPKTKAGGYTILRFDDTNPEAEKIEFIESIIDDVKWMGHKPAQINYSSDYFPQLYEWAIQLIKEDKAYVDHQTPEEIQKYREERKDSPWRNRPIEESLKLFQDMRKGKFKEGEATLRLKMDMQSENTVMRDLIAYRIKYTAHPHVGDKWCIYPSYDYTHCLIDSIENITHSLCTLEFMLRRTSYYWLVDALRLYKPLVWEYSRLNITYTLLSKRKLKILVKEGHVKGWDDPRMPTIRGLRRRGYTPTAINNFCDKIGVTRNENTISVDLLENCCRDDLDKIAHRAMCVLDPLKVTITNWEGGPKQLQVPNFPKDTSRGTHPVVFSKTIYIDRSDFREQDVKGYKRLAPNKEVGLMHAGAHITCKEVVKDKQGNIIELKAVADFAPSSVAKGYIHWVAEPTPGKEPHKIEVHLYDRLFKSPDPASYGEDWLKDLNPNSLQIVSGAYVDDSVKDAKVGDRFQFERVGYFCVDFESKPEHQIWNRIVSLKEAKWEEKSE